MLTDVCAAALTVTTFKKEKFLVQYSCHRHFKDPTLPPVMTKNSSQNAWHHHHHHHPYPIMEAFSQHNLTPSYTHAFRPYNQAILLSNPAIHSNEILPIPSDRTYCHTRYVRKVMRLIRENSFNWRYVYAHLIFFKITSLSINTPLPAVLPRVVARLEVVNWDHFQSIRHGSLHVFNSPKMASFQAGFEPGKQKEIGRGSPDLGWAVPPDWLPLCKRVSCVL